MISIATLLIASALAGASQAPDAASTSDASLARVRAALEQPPSKLAPPLPERKADFTVIISERERFERLLPPILDFKVGPGLSQEELYTTSPYGSQPLFTVDLMSMAMAAVAGVNAVRKAHARRAALDEVRRTIADFCLAQPDAGAGIQICTSSLASR